MSNCKTSSQREDYIKELSKFININQVGPKKARVKKTIKTDFFRLDLDLILNNFQFNFFVIYG